jgi:hypothetical protein
MLAVLAVGLVAAGVLVAYENRGGGGRIVGLCGIAALFFAAFGLYKGVKSFQEEEIFFLFSWIGTVVNAVVLVMMLLVMLVGV